MTTIASAGARLDRLPISPFHYRIFWLIAAGMFFDGYDLYVGGSVLGAAVQTQFSSWPRTPQFISLTFVGMTIGSLLAGFLGDRFGRRFTYQFNLMIFGLASFAAASRPASMADRRALRDGPGLGAEIVVGYSTMTEFVPPASRGKLDGVHGLYRRLRLSRHRRAQHAGHPRRSAGGRCSSIAGVGALIVWYLRKNLPESPRWLESNGRAAEAEALMQAIEREAPDGRALAAAGARRADAGGPSPRCSAPPCCRGWSSASVVLITVNTLIFGFVNWLPTFFVQQGIGITKSLTYTMVIAAGSLVGCAVGALCADSLRPQADHHRRLGLDHLVRRRLPLHGRSRLLLADRLCPDRRHLCPDRPTLRRLHYGAVSHRGAAAGQRPLQHAGPRRHRRVALHRPGAVQEQRRRRRAGLMIGCS